MAIVVEPDHSAVGAAVWPLLAHADSTRTIAWRHGRPVSVGDFLADVERAAEALPDASHAINLCQDRYAFLVAFCAVACRGQTTLMPSSRAPQAVDEAQRAHARSYSLCELVPEPCPQPLTLLPSLYGADVASSVPIPDIALSQTVAIGFTSGSTGQPKPNAKSWRDFRRCSLANAYTLRNDLGLQPGRVAHIVATVPAQHMYGMEMSILLPLFGEFSIHAGQPFFAGDVAAALTQVPEPRILVTTPMHLRTLLRDDVELPALAGIISATAPLPAAWAEQAEARFGAPLIELFGSTETCVIARRRPAHGSDWHLYDGVDLRPQPDGSLVRLGADTPPTMLQDVVELLPKRHFRLCGRNSDLLEIAGKRASLADLTRRLLSIDGVVDGIMFQLDATHASGIQRIAALVVAPSLNEADIRAALRHAMDPVFLPRPLQMVSSLPRNETGKLPRAALLACINLSESSVSAAG